MNEWDLTHCRYCLWFSTLDNISHGWLEWRGKVLLCCDARVLALARQPPWWPGWPIRHRDVTGRGVQCSVFSVVVVTLVNISTPGPGPSIVWSTCQHVTQPRSPPASVLWPGCQVQWPAACCVPPLSFLASIKMLQISFMIHSAVRMSGKSCAGQRPSETSGGKNLGR